MPVSEGASADPRDRVTPDAFHVDPALLNHPLAGPWRRGAALSLDLCAIGVLSTLGATFLVGLGGYFLFRYARRRQQGIRKTVTIGLALTLIAVGVLGVFASGFWKHWIPGDPEVQVSATEGGLGRETGLSGADVKALLADDPDEVRQSARHLAETILQNSESHDPADEIRDLSEALGLLGISAERQQWIEAGFEEALQQSALTTSEMGGEARIETLKQDLRQTRQKNRELEAELAEARSRRSISILGQIKALAEDAGITFFWSTLYFTALPGLYRGRTLGKALLRLRIVRLDGRRLSVWNAFERHGGYLAGLATGLLGFAQIWWDANRQGIQDKIAGTVVIRADRAPPKIHSEDQTSPQS